MDPRTVRMLEQRRQAKEVPSSSVARRPLVSPAVADWLSVNWFKASLALAIIIVALSVGHYTMVTLPALNREQMAAQQEAEKRRGLQAIYNDVGLQSCLDSASKNYHTDWEAECNARKLGIDCRLPGGVADRFEERLRESRNECLKRYPPK
jgi:hypothetical protein